MIARIIILLACLLGALSTGIPGAASAATWPLDTGWRLQLDPQAQWQDDTLYLPEEVDLTKMPTNPPTGGWKSLSSQAGLPVNLPSTVEEHYWGKAPAGVAAGSSPTDIVNAQGNYVGVSWWYRPFQAPKLRPGEHLIVTFPGARQRAEVYVNGALVGYDLIAETPFSADVTKALKHGGPNLLAVRITNPGGRFDWVDFLTMKWGRYTLPATHGFGGIDGGVTMDIRSAVAVSDLTVLNHSDLHTVTVRSEVASSGPAYSGPITLSIRQFGKTVWTGSAAVHVPAGGTAVVAKEATVGSAKPWDINHPVLYQAAAALPAFAHSDRSTTFGFRWFTAQGIGTDAKILLNGRRFVPRSSISWGYWAPNGLFPDRNAADREAAAVRALGLTGLQNHRHMPKPIVLDAFDRAGLLRYCEPGCGIFTFTDQFDEHHPMQGPIDTSGKGGEPVSFLAKYELAKVLAMVRTDRSHPSVIIWSLQNEISPDLHNPRIFYTLRKMREADPSRIIMLKSGIGSDKQVWSLPYSNTWMYDHGDGFSGWWDQHTATASAGVYQDGMYRSPTDFLYYSANSKEIVTWGEMATGASPDDHTADVAWYQGGNRQGYDLAAHQALVGSYDKFLQTYGFHHAFPTAKSLFLAAGDKHYFSAARILENARIANNNDYIVLSGWESTTIDNHSGLTDSLRFLKGDPAPIKRAAAPELLVVRPRHYVVAAGAEAAFDVHLVNERNLHGSYRLTVKALQDGKPFFAKTVPVTVRGGDTFGQLLQENIIFVPRNAGPITIAAALFPPNLHRPTLSRTEPMLAIDPAPVPLTGSVAFAGTSPHVGDALATQFHLSPIPLAQAQGPLGAILIAAESGQNNLQPYNVDDMAITNTADPGLYRRQMWGPAGPVLTVHHLTPGKVTVELHFADTYFDKPEQRVFDVAINGASVLKDFDIAREAGGGGRALVKTFTVDAPTGVVAITVPNVRENNAQFAAVRITDSAGVVVRQVFRDTPYVDSAGATWNPFSIGTFDWARVLPDALDRVRQDGTRLVLLTSGDDAAAAAAILASRNIVTYSGDAGAPGPSWLGFWYFGRRHWLLDGLPSDCVLDWQYQIGNGAGLFLSGSHLEAVIGYGKNHDPRLGIGAAVIPYGKGQIVLFDLPGFERAFIEGDGSNFQPVTAKRLLYNALRK